MSIVSEDAQRSHSRMMMRDQELKANDPRFNHVAMVQHEDGSIQTMVSAFFEGDPVDPQFLWMFYEHGQPMCFSRDELLRAIEYTEHRHEDVGELYPTVITDADIESAVRRVYADAVEHLRDYCCTHHLVGATRRITFDDLETLALGHIPDTKLEADGAGLRPRIRVVLVRDALSHGYHESGWPHVDVSWNQSRKVTSNVTRFDPEALHTPTDGTMEWNSASGQMQWNPWIKKSPERP